MSLILNSSEWTVCKGFVDLHGVVIKHFSTLIVTKPDVGSDWHECACFPLIDTNNPIKVTVSSFDLKTFCAPFNTKVATQVTTTLTYNLGDRVRLTRDFSALGFLKGTIGTITSCGEPMYDVKFGNVSYPILFHRDNFELESSVTAVQVGANPTTHLPAGDANNLWHHAEHDEAPYPGHYSEGETYFEGPPIGPKCECGVASVGGGNHSSWCPIK